MKQRNVCILGAGFSCIDVVKVNKKEIIIPGGTAGNVLSVLGKLNMDVKLLIAKYSDEEDEWLKEALKVRNIECINFTTTRIHVPKIVELLDIDNKKHQFSTLCPMCGEKLNTIVLPNKKHIMNIASKIYKKNNLFFYDRLSEGIRKIAEDNLKGWNFYEPNSCRMYKNLLEGSKISNIVKVSQDRIPNTMVEKLIKDLSYNTHVKIVIVTMGDKGLKFVYRNKNGEFGEWYNMPAYDINKVIDSSGAGDWLTAIFIYYLLQEYPYCCDEIDMEIIKKILNIAQKVASITCKYIGAQGVFYNKEGLKKIGNELGMEIKELNEEEYPKRISCDYCKR